MSDVFVSTERIPRRRQPPPALRPNFFHEGRATSLNPTLCTEEWRWKEEETAIFQSSRRTKTHAERFSETSSPRFIEDYQSQVYVRLLPSYPSLEGIETMGIRRPTKTLRPSRGFFNPRDTDWGSLSQRTKRKSRQPPPLFFLFLLPCFVPVLLIKKRGVVQGVRVWHCTYVPLPMS